MELNHSFTVPVGADDAFEVLTDIERIAPCMPGAKIESVDGDEFTGSVKVKVGPMQVTYRGKASYAELNRDSHRAVIEARAQETRGNGTVDATITAQLEPVSEGETRVSVDSDLAITGRPAQFGRGVMNEVGSKLLGRFADCLSSRLTGDDAAEDDTEDSVVGKTVGLVGTNGSSAAASEREVTQQVGTTPPQPASGAAPAAAAAAPSAAAATSGATPAASADDSSDADASAKADDAPSPITRTTTPRQTSTAEVEPIDLFEVAGPSMIKRALPVVAAAVALFLLWRRRRS